MTYGARQGKRESIKLFTHTPGPHDHWRNYAPVLGQVKYKPGWKLAWRYPWSGPGLFIRWEMRVPDAFDHDKEVDFTSAEVFIERPDEEGIVREAYRLALRAEQHEAAEFFTYRGKRVFDPHRSILAEGERYG